MPCLHPFYSDCHQLLLSVRSHVGYRGHEPSLILALLGVVSVFLLYCWQVVEDGYEFFAERQLVTIFSAPNYCGEFDNAGAMMSVDDTLMCSFQILKPADKKLKFNFGSTTTSKPGNSLTGMNMFGSTTTTKPGNSPTGVKVNTPRLAWKTKSRFTNGSFLME